MWYNLETFGMKLAERPYGNIIAERQIALLHCAVTSSPHRGSVRKTSSQEWVCTLWGRRLQLICSLRSRSYRACIPRSCWSQSLCKAAFARAAMLTRWASFRRSNGACILRAFMW